MTVRIAKPPVNIREKLAELERPIGLNGQALLATETPQQAFDLLGAGRKNRIINGGMQIDQRYNGSLFSSANGFITDRWTGNWYAPAGGSYSGQQVSDAPAGFRNSLKITTTAVPSNNTNSYFQIFQIIEGYNIADLMMGTTNAKTFTCSFWVKSSIVGTYSICFFNNQQTVRAYNTTYNINTANTWEYKAITVPGDTSTTGTWGSTNGNGLGVFFDMGSGTNQEASANSWVTTNTRRVAGTVRLINTNGATWQITGVQLEVGKVATPFEYRSIGQELALCQRYYYASANHHHVLFKNSFWESSTFYFPETMRAAPSVSLTGSPGTLHLRLLNGNSDIGNTPVYSTFTDGFLLVSSTTNNDTFYNWILNGTITASAEL